VSDLQHQRLTDLPRELRLSAVPDLYWASAERGGKDSLLCRLSRRDLACRA
jgi:hypothetical protein